MVQDVGTDDGLELTTKGQIHTFSTENTALNVSSDDYVLTADSTTATGLAWLDSGSIKHQVALVIACGTETDAISATGQVISFRIPYNMTLNAGIAGITGSLVTAGTGVNKLTVDIEESGSSILSTALTFDSTESTTTTASRSRCNFRHGTYCGFCDYDKCNAIGFGRGFCGLENFTYWIYNMSYLVNPYLYASSGEWYSYEDSSTYSIPVGPNLFSSPLPQYYDVGSGNEFYKFKYKASLSTSYAGGNYNGSISMWVGNLLKTSSQSGGYCPEGAFITTGRHRHNSGSTDQSYFAQNWNDSGGTCNVPTGTGCPQVSQINDYGCGDGLIVGSQNVELEYDGDDTGGTAYF